jgi:hypothetical protein
MSSPIPELPVELIANIFEHTDPRCLKTTLKNAALVSKKWHNIAIPFLYRRIDINTLSLEFPRNKPSKLRTLTALFLRNPDLANYVRHFSLRPRWNSGNPHDRKTERSLEELRARVADTEIANAIADASHSDKEQAIWLEQWQTEDSLLALLLPCLTKLETLDLGFDKFRASFVERMLHRAAQRRKPFDKRPAFERLHSFVFPYWDSHHGGHLTGIPFTLPSVRSVFFHGICSGEYVDDPAGDKVERGFTRIKPRTSSCTHLELKQCRLSPPDLKAILSLPIALKTFIYKVGWGYLAWCRNSFTALREALDSQKATLETLELNFVTGIQWWPPEMDETSPMASLREFPVLKRLRVAPDFVFGTASEAGGRRYKRLLEFLPSGLEVLHIAHGDKFASMIVPDNMQEVPQEENLDTLYRGVVHVYENKEAIVPSLSKVVFDSVGTNITGDWGQFARIFELAEATKVPFILRVPHTQSKPFPSHGEASTWGWDRSIKWMPLSGDCEDPMREFLDFSHS